MNDADLDLVMFVENVFDTHILEEDGELTSFGIEESLECSLSHRCPTIYAAELLRTLAKTEGQPELAEGVDKPWRREQVGALLHDILRKRTSAVELHEMLLLPRPRHLGRQHSSGWRSLLTADSSALIFAVLLALILLFRSFSG